MNDPMLVMADTFVRLIAVESVRVLTWLPLVLVTAYLHARWSRR